MSETMEGSLKRRVTIIEEFGSRKPIVKGPTSEEIKTERRGKNIVPFSFKTIRRAFGLVATLIAAMIKDRQ